MKTHAEDFIYSFFMFSVNISLTKSCTAYNSLCRCSDIQNKTPEEKFDFYVYRYSIADIQNRRPHEKFNFMFSVLYHR